MKDFLIIGNMNACTCKEVFPLFLNGMKISGVKGYTYTTPEGGTKKFGNICWYTNLKIKPVEPPVLSQLYNPTDYPKYDNYEAINVDRLKDIPIDYDGVMGVPITILKYLNNDNQIELNVPYDIKAILCGNTRQNCPSDILEELEYTPMKEDRGGCGVINGERVYTRVLIQKYNIIDGLNRYAVIDAENKNEWIKENHKHSTTIDGNPKFFRVLIRKYSIVGELHHGMDNEFDRAKPVINGKETYVRILVQKEKAPTNPCL